jgi:ABC-type sugar transport system ATPase subunit
LECVFQNNEITLNKPKDAVNIGFAYVSGNRETEGTFQQRSISENLRAVSDLVLKNPIDDENTYLKKYGVVFGKSQDLITSLSGGNQQKVVIGRWMATTPKIFIAEDPTKGIDVQARRDVHKMLYSLAKGGSMVVMSSSDDEEIVELTTHAELARVLVMYEGKVVAQLEGQDITLEKIAANSLGKKDE